jgi:hypothetical protein
MIIVPLSYAYQEQMGNDVVRGGSPYGMTTTTNSDGSRQPSPQELDGAKFQGKRVAEIAKKAAQLSEEPTISGGRYNRPPFSLMDNLQIAKRRHSVIEECADLRLHVRAAPRHQLHR